MGKFPFSASITFLFGLPPTRALAVCRASKQRQTKRSARRHFSNHNCLNMASNMGTSEGNLLSPIRSLRQDYYALRHGQSLANVEGIIMSDPTKACTNYGLSEKGKQQATAAADDVRTTFVAHGYEGLVILTSDLLRAKETAVTVFDGTRDLPTHEDRIIIETRLRERWFGEWDGTSDENYHKVWKDDEFDSSHTLKRVESVNEVMERTTKCILEWDDHLASKYEEKRCMVILVAHGDVLQILQTAFEKMDGRLHRTLQHLETAQLRQLKLAASKI